MASSEPKSNHSSAPEFEFITLTQRPASHKNDFSYTVRSHAMQSFLRQKNNAKISKEVQTATTHSSVESKTPRELSGKFKLAAWSRKPRRKAVKKGAVETVMEVGNELSPMEKLLVQKVSRLCLGYSAKGSRFLGANYSIPPSLRQRTTHWYPKLQHATIALSL